MKANGTAASEKLPGSSAHRPGATTWLSLEARGAQQIHKPDGPIRHWHYFFGGEKRQNFGIICLGLWVHPARGRLAFLPLRSPCPLSLASTCHFRPEPKSTAARRPRAACCRPLEQSDRRCCPLPVQQPTVCRFACFTPGVANREPACASVRHTGQTSATHCCRAIGLSLFFLSFIFPLDGHPPTLASAASLLSSPRPPSLRRP